MFLTPPQSLLRNLYFLAPPHLLLRNHPSTLPYVGTVGLDQCFPVFHIMAHGENDHL